MRRTVLLAAAALAFVAATTALAAAAAPKASLAEIEAEVMCPICGTLLELSNSPQAEQEKAFIARLIAQGRSTQQIKDELVAQYGKRVLAVPDESGFDLSAYLVPIFALVIAVIALAAGLVRWRKRSPNGSDPPSPSPPQGADAERLEADIARYDL